jgi:4-amino-4-deoxy-L-arabinose transferase-like glycosyltransferase
MFAAIINAYGNLAEQVHYALIPVGPVLFWACSLGAVLGLMLADPAIRAAATEDETGLPGGLVPSFVAAITILGAALRLYGRDALPFWWDELLSMWIAHSDLPTLFRTLATPAAPGSDFNPPLFYLFLHGWQNIFGLGEGAARALTGLCSTLTIPALYLLVRRLAGVGTALGAAFLLAVSGIAISYGQQARDYSLLALLAILFLLAAEMASRRLSRWRTTGLVACGVLFLHTHYLAVWMYAAVCGVYALLEAWRSSLLSASVTTAAAWANRIRFPSALVAGFLLAAVSPLFSFPAVSQAVLLVGGLLLLGLLLATGMGEIRETPSPPKRSLLFLTALAAPGLLFLPWLLSTRVWEVIAGQGAKKMAQVYGLKEMGGAIDAFCGLDMGYIPYLLGLGFFSLLLRRPRTALLLAAWIVAPMVVAMYLQYQHMHLERYLFFTQPGYLLLISAAVMETLTWPVAGVRALAARVFPGRPVPRQLLPLAGFCTVVALFGFISLSRVSFPTRIVDVEHYPLAAKDMAGRDHLCPGFPSPNLLRAISWYLDREGKTKTTCRADDDRTFLMNTDYEGQPWSNQADLAAWLNQHGTSGPQYPRLHLFTVPPTPLPSPTIENEKALFNLGGRDLFLGMEQGNDIAYADGLLRPLFKGKTATARIVLPMPAQRIGKATITVAGVASGPKSFIRLRLAMPGQEAASVRMTVTGDGSSRGGLSLEEAANAGMCAMRDGMAVCTFPAALSVGPEKPLALDIELFDDASGAIYSSDVGLKSVGMTLETDRP